MLKAQWRARVYLQILDHEFVLTFHARLESVGLIYTVYPG